MRAVVQRVLRAAVRVDDVTVAEIRHGMVALVGVSASDGQTQVAALADKVANIRLFADEADKMNLSVRDVGGQVLAVSQFTLAADTRKGRRPSFTDAAAPEVAEGLFEAFVAELRAGNIDVRTGRFRSHMVVSLDNDGPVTFVLDV